jgi:signal peptidase I
MSRLKKWSLIIVSILAVIVIVLVLIRTFIFIVSGPAMLPTYKSYDYGFVNLFNRTFERKDVVVYSVPGDFRKFRIARIIGLPSELVEIKNGDVYIDGKVLDETEYWSDESVTQGKISVQLGEDEYYVLSDNRTTVADSRVSGPIKLENIRGEFMLLSR